MRKLRIIMADREMTNKELADMVGVHEATVSRWKKSQKLTMENLYKLAEKLNVEPKDLLD